MQVLITDGPEWAQGLTADFNFLNKQLHFTKSVAGTKPWQKADDFSWTPVLPVSDPDKRKLVEYLKAEATPQAVHNGLHIRNASESQCWATPFALAIASLGIEDQALEQELVALSKVITADDYADAVAFLNGDEH